MCCLAFAYKLGLLDTGTHLCTPAKTCLLIVCEGQIEKNRTSSMHIANRLEAWSRALRQTRTSSRMKLGAERPISVSLTLLSVYCQRLIREIVCNFTMHFERIKKCGHEPNQGISVRGCDYLSISETLSLKYHRCSSWFF